MRAVACIDVGGGAWRVVSGSVDNTVHVWDGAAGGAALLVLEGHTEYVTAVACHGVGEGGSAQRHVVLWTSTGEGQGRPRTRPTLGP